MLYCNDTRRCLYFLEYVLPIRPLGYLFLVFKYKIIIHLWTIFSNDLGTKINLFDAEFLTDLFIWAKI